MLSLCLMIQSFKVIKQLFICVFSHSQTSQFLSAHRTRKYWMHLSQYQFTAWRHKTLSIHEQRDKKQNKNKKRFSLRLIMLDFVKIEGEPCNWPACFDSKGRDSFAWRAPSTNIPDGGLLL